MKHLRHPLCLATKPIVGQLLCPRTASIAAVLLAICCGRGLAAEEFYLHEFERIQLTDVYYSEGANFGDVNGDGNADAVYGPYWFEGPDFTQKHEIYPAQPQPRERYADNFFSWLRDFDGDGDNDVFVVGFPGRPAYVYENPGAGDLDRLWEKHEVFDSVANESPQFTDIVGDARPELVCTRGGLYGYATIDWEQPFEPWKFHVISDQKAPNPFGHGLGVGDVDGDGRNDVLCRNGWFEQPADAAGESQWTFHPVQFARAGGADMFAYDVDGDGDNDVITSLAAHSFGLAWYEQVREEGRIDFRQHLIMGSKPEENPYGVVFSELHTVNLADMDGDGLKDIVTGKTYWSHHRQAPMWDAGAVVYWFKLVRDEDGVDWIPYKADGEAGVGRQVIVGDVNNDDLPDVVVGGMVGAHVLLHRRKEVDRAEWQRFQPKRTVPIADGLQPAEAAAQMTAPPGFEVQLAAGEPQVHQPIALAIDPRGRVWVAEAYTYPIRAPEGKGRDKIVILEDTDRDGTLDSRKVFAEGLNLVSGLQVGFGGVWVGAAPYLLFIPDRDGDDQPDGPPEVLLDGFGYHDTHETLNAFIWGPDGWLYGCHGVFTHSRVGKPGTPDAERTPLNAGVWRYHPVRHEFEVFAWGSSNPWGVDFDDHGQAFMTACVIPHLWHVVQGARYHRQGGRHFNPHVYDDIKTIADHSHYAGNIRDHAWWGHEPMPPQATLAAGGGHAHCGAMIYLGDNWPAAYRNRIFMNNIHGNRVNCDHVERAGSGFVGRHDPDFLLANDKWFRGINLKYGPDGTVYLIDWYDRNACHRTNPEIWDRTNGRVYNISYGRPERTPVDLTKLDDEELVQLQLHANDWHVRTARRLLQERSAAGSLDAAVHDALWKIVHENGDVTRQLRAVWTLHAIGGLDGDDLLDLMQHPHEYMRGWAVQLECEDRSAPEAARRRLAELAENDPSPVVRRYVASALQRLPLEERWPLAAALAGHEEDAGDHNLPLLLWYGVEPLVKAEPQRAMALAAESRLELLTRYIYRRAASENGTLEHTVAALSAAEDAETRQLILDEMLAAFEGRVNIPMPKTWAKAYEQLVQSKKASIRNRADQVAVVLGDQRIFPRMRHVLSDSDAKLDRRKQALDILIRGRDKQAAPALLAAVDTPQLRGPAIRALAAYDDRRIAPKLVSAYPRLSPKERQDAVGTLVARPDSALALLDAIEQARVPRTDLHAYHIRQLLDFENDRLNERIREVWGEIRPTTADKRERIAEYKKMLTPARVNAGDPSNGRRLFARSCASCHKLFGEGGQVGPDITGSNRANLDYLLENLLDPSAVLGKDYRMTVLATVDGRVISGLVQKETDSALTIRTINDTLVVAKDDVEERRLSELSLMPERQLDQLQPQEVVDLVAYLGAPAQVPLRGPSAPIDSGTRRVPGALEGESLAIKLKTAGNARSQKMSPFPKDRWSGDDQLWWTGAAPGDRLELELPVERNGLYEIEIVLTMARDYGVVQLDLDGENLGGPIDLFNTPDVITTGVLSFAAQQLPPGNHRLGLQITGAHPKAVKAYMVGLDYVRLVPAAAAGE